MQQIVILDFGGQYTHLIARRIRQLGIYASIKDPDDFEPNQKNGEDADTVGLIFSGGPQSVNAENAHKINFNIKEVQVPILGICYGHQLIASIFGGEIYQSKRKEYGLSEIKCDTSSTLFKSMDERQTMWMSHGDHVEKMPDNFKITSYTEDVPVASYESKDARIFGVQFHPEVTHSENGLNILDNFISVCTNERDWKVENYKDDIIEEIRQKAKNKKLFLLLSGGVDSLVALRLCIEALGEDSIQSLHIDTGYMRKNESSDIIRHFNTMNFKNITVKNAEDVFVKNIEKQTDPETKRKIMGKLFIDVMKEELQKMDITDEKEWMLVQGTIYPDTVESGGTKKATAIKTHHNRVKEIEDLIAAGKVIEPIRELYKDEVRELGKELGLPSHLVDRQPFPGPGLAIRILASDTDKPDKDVDKEESELQNMIDQYGLGGMILPVRSVGVQGDFRTYHHPALIYYKDTDPLKFDWNVLKVASKSINKLDTVNRMVFSYDYVRSSLKLGVSYPTKKQADLLREVDHVVHDMTSDLTDIWQMPVVSLPLFDDKGDQCFVMRPVSSKDAMSADFYGIDFALLEKIIESVKSIKGVGNLFYDITSKPPATIEWE